MLQGNFVFEKYKVILFFAAVLLATAVSAFWIPFLFPPKVLSYSQSYVVGFNNRVASGLLIAISIAATWFCFNVLPAASCRKQANAHRTMSLWYLAIAGLLESMWIAFTAKLILAHTSRSVEDFTFIPQMQKVFFFHRELYKQVEFAYGPLFFYPTLWLAKCFGFYAGPVDLAYYLTLLIHHLLGLGILFYLLNRLPLNNIFRIAIFVAISIYGFNPVMGLNYTLFRFTSPLFFIVLLAGMRRALSTSFVSACATMLLFGISAEIGTAFLLGVFALCSARLLRGERNVLFMLLGALAGVGLIAVFIPSEYFRSILYFSHGYNNLVLLPRPEIVLLLICATVLAPIVVAQNLKSDKHQGEVLLSVFAVSLGMLPAALGAAEILHVLGNGVGFFLLGSLAFVGRRMPAILFSGALFAVHLLMLAEFYKEARIRLFMAVTCGDQNHLLQKGTSRIPKIGKIVAVAETFGCPAYVPLEKLEKYTTNEDFVIPWVTDANTSERIVMSPRYQPSYFHGTINSWSSETQRTKIAEMRKVRWAIIYLDRSPHELPVNVNFAMSWPTHFTERHRVYSDDLMVEELERNWIPISHLDSSMILYKRVH